MGGGILGSLIFGDDHLSVRQHSTYNPVPWTTGGGPLAFRGFCRRTKESSR